MVKLRGWVATVILGTASALAQQPGAGPPLTNLMQTLQFAEMVRAAALSPDQLAALAQLQKRWLEGLQASAPLTDAVLDACLQVLKGKATDEAINGMGGAGQELRQAQEQVQRASQTLAIELRETLKPEQRQALLAYESPERGLAGLVQALRQVRKAPQPEWEQMRRDLTGAMAGFAGPRATPAVPEATIGEWLDRARLMSDAEFDKAAPALPGEWARALAPEMMRQLDDPRLQEQRLLDLCRRLIGDPAGHDLLMRLLAEAPNAPPAGAVPPAAQPAGQGAPAPGR